MSRAVFAVTYEIVTEESASDGGAEESGFIDAGMCLRDAIAYVRRTRTNRVDGVTSIECDSSPCVCPRRVTITNGMEFETGACESRSLHIPESVTAASARRIARLLGVKTP